MNYSSKKLISENLENWFTMDHILFGGIPKSYLNETSLKKYEELKKIYLTSLYEMYKYIGYTSKYQDCPTNSVDIEIKSLKSIHEARILSARKLVKESKKIANVLKESKKELLNTNLKKIQLSSLFESAFVDRQFKSAKNPNNFGSPKFLLLQNCLTECKKELIAMSLKYFRNK